MKTSRSFHWVRAWLLLLACVPACRFVSQAVATEATIEFLRQPTNLTVLMNNPATFSVVVKATANGTNVDPVIYQWQRAEWGGTEWLVLSGATNSSYTATTLACSQTPALFRCEVSAGDAVAFSQPAQLFVIADCSPPVITSASGDARSNQVTVAFSDMMDPSTMTDPFSYFLTDADSGAFFNILGVLVRDARTAVLIVDSLNPLQHGTRYRLRASGISDLSDPACSCNLIPADTTVFFTTPERECVRITRQPRSWTAATNCPVTFEVDARWVDNSFPRTVGYQWFKDGAPIPGATNHFYTTAPVQLADHGTIYHAVVSSACNTVTSSNAVLHVSPDAGAPPQLLGARPGLAADTVVLSFASVCGTPDGRLDPVVAGNSLSYTVGGGNDFINVIAARLDCSGTNVILKTSPQDAGHNYTVSIHGIPDVAGYVTPDQTVGFTPPVRLPLSARKLRAITDVEHTILEWSAGGILQTSDKPNGPWTDISQATSPYFVTPSSSACKQTAFGPVTFYRVRWPTP